MADTLTAYEELVIAKEKLSHFYRDEAIGRLLGALLKLSQSNEPILKDSHIEVINEMANFMGQSWPESIGLYIEEAKK